QPNTKPPKTQTPPAPLPQRHIVHSYPLTCAVSRLHALCFLWASRDVPASPPSVLSTLRFVRANSKTNPKCDPDPAILTSADRRVLSVSALSSLSSSRHPPRPTTSLL